MKKNYTFKEKQMIPKKETIQFLLQFSKSVEVVEGKKKQFLVSKN